MKLHLSAGIMTIDQAVPFNVVRVFHCARFLLETICWTLLSTKRTTVHIHDSLICRVARYLYFHVPWANVCMDVVFLGLLVKL